MIEQGPMAVQRIVILGGGTSGWMAAAYLKRSLGPTVHITLIESPDIGRIGVGEGSIPSIKEEVFDFLGIPETEWMPKCKATFKMGIRYVNWAKTPKPGEQSHFYHLFGEVPNIDGTPLTHYWLKKKLAGATDEPLAYACYAAAKFCDQNRSPRTMNGEMVANYSYHFDATLVGNVLQDWAIAHGVEHVQAIALGATQKENGDLDAIQTKDGRAFSADLFIDCTGFAGVLINKTLKEQFIPYNDALLCDSALAILQHSTPEEDARMVPYTTATALKYGWCWRIPLPGRTGNGYVFSSKFVDPKVAAEEYRAHLNLPESAELRLLKTRVGRNRNSWVKNCVAIGLASSFIEPLEATGIYMTYAALYQLVRHFPTKRMEPALQAKFNERIAYMTDDIRDFIVLHYCTSQRDDTAFWKACQHDLAISPSLQETIDVFKAGAPVKVGYSGGNLYKQFEASFDRFWSNSNYTAIFAGMGVMPEQSYPLLNFRPAAVEEAEREFQMIAKTREMQIRDLPSQYDYLMSLHKKAA